MDKTAVVTGGTKGIGAAVVKRLREDGFRVCAVYRSDDAAAQGLLDEYGGKDVIVRKADISDYSAAARLYNDVYREFGKIDASVHCAGIELSKILALTSPEEWSGVISVNLNGAFNCCKCAVKKMLPRGYGRIINVSSAAAALPNEGQSAYAASKAGINALTKALAKETARFGITVNAVAPGFVRGEMAERYENKYKNAVPLRRFADPCEIAELIAFLAGDKASYAAGAVFTIDGGIGGSYGAL